MSKSKKILEMVDLLYSEKVPDITSDDTIIQNVTDPNFQCPTCGNELKILPNVSNIECLHCGNISAIGQAPLSHLRHHRLDYNKGI